MTPMQAAIHNRRVLGGRAIHEEFRKNMEQRDRMRFAFILDVHTGIMKFDAAVSEYFERDDSK